MAEQPKVLPMYVAQQQQGMDFRLNETRPSLGDRRLPGLASTYDLVEKMQYLYVRIVKARNLPSKGSYIEVRVGNHKRITKNIEKNEEVFAFSKDQLQSSLVEITVKDMNDEFVGKIHFDAGDIPTRAPPDSQLAPEWFLLENARGEKLAKGEVMLAVWFGTQADECFANAWHSDAAASVGSHIRSKIYHAPRLWYVRVNVIEAQDIVKVANSRIPELFVRAKIGNQVLRTKIVSERTLSPLWNEDLMFVAAEPFEEKIVLTVEDHVGSNKDETIGWLSLPLGSVERRFDDRTVGSRWYGLDSDSKEKFSGRIHLRVCLDGGYHVLDESTHYSTDLRPSAKQLWRPSIGLLELGILNAAGLHPMKTREGKGTSDTYCVAKYGHKWVRTRTIIDSLSPRFNEQYTWEVYDLATVLIVCIFDNSQIDGGGGGESKDARIGKVRIRLSLLEIGRIYTHSYPLIVLNNSGIKKMGELHLAIRLSSTSLADNFLIYSRPLLPKMHYVRPLSVVQLDMLRYHAVQVVAARLSRMEPPLKKEVIEYILDADSHLWSMRRSKANFYRLVSVFSCFCKVGRWFDEVVQWKNPVTTVLVHVLFVLLVCFPENILPTAFLFVLVTGLWNYRRRPRHPPQMDAKMSCADMARPDELDEEFDSFPTTRSAEVVRMRYDRMRSVAGRVQTVVGDLASQGERVQALLSWRDPRATTIFLVFSSLAALVLYVTPFQVVAVVAGFYVMRHPRFRQRFPLGVVNFFRRLPTRMDSLL